MGKKGVKYHEERNVKSDSGRLDVREDNLHGQDFVF